MKLVYLSKLRRDSVGGFLIGPQANHIRGHLSSAPKKQAGMRHRTQASSANVNSNNNKLLHPQYYTVFLQTKAYRKANGQMAQY